MKSSIYLKENLLNKAIYIIKTGKEETKEAASYQKINNYLKQLEEVEDKAGEELIHKAIKGIP